MHIVSVLFRAGAQALDFDSFTQAPDEKPTPLRPRTNGPFERIML